MFIVFLLRKAACARRETFTNIVIGHDSTGILDCEQLTVVIMETKCYSYAILLTLQHYCNELIQK